MPDDLSQSTTGQIPTNLRLLVLLERIAAEGAPVSPSALSTALDLPKATIHRLLATAEDEGFLQRDLDGRSYGPGVRLRKLSANTLSSQRVRTERLLVMKALAEEVGETCNLAAPGRYGMVYLDRVETHWPLRIQLPVGTQVPFHCTASGKMYLSSLRQDKLLRLLETMPLDPQTPASITDPKSFWMKSQQPAHAAIPPTIKNSWKAWPPSPFPYATTNRDCSQPSRSMPQSKGTICPN